MYDENGDDIITLEEMTRLFEDKELGANLYEDLHMFKGVRINSSFAYQITVFLSHAKNIYKYMYNNRAKGEDRKYKHYTFYCMYNDLTSL